jgi:hypothetical protein
LADETLESEQHFTYVVIDDLDLTWVEDDLANVLIKCLLQVALEMQRASRIKILVALRTNIFDQLHVGDQVRGGQEEKLRATAMMLRWSRAALEHLVNLRLAAESDRLNLGKVLTLDSVLPAASQHGISAWSYVLNRTLLRPRDVILYLNRCFEEGVSTKPRISWNTIKDVERAYSRDRLNALRDEWNDPFVDLARVLELFRGRPHSFGIDILGEVCEDAALLLIEGGGDAAHAFRGASWLTPLCEPMWQPGAYKASWRDRFGPLCEVLFDIGFLGVAPKPRHDPVFATDPSSSLSDLLVSATDQTEFSVHLAFRLALDMVQPGP